MTLQYVTPQSEPFFCVLTGGLSDGSFELRTFKDSEGKRPPDARLWFTDAGEEADFVNKRLAEKEHIYIGVSARRPKKGDKANLLYTHVLHVEMDFKDFAAGEKEARARLAAYPLPPTMIVHSGGGLHVYWKIGRFDLTSEQCRIRLERALKQLCKDVGGDPAATDCSRILRIPGTWNVKAKYGEPRPVVLEYCDLAAAPYSFDAFPLLPEPKKPQQVRSTQAYSPSGLAPDDLTVIHTMVNSPNKGGKIRRLLAGQLDDFNGNHSSADQSLCDYLAYYCGFNGHAQVKRIWQDSNLWREKGDEKHSSDGRSYADMTIDKAYAGRTEFHNWNPSARAVTPMSAPRIEAEEPDTDAPTDDTAAQATGEEDIPADPPQDVVKDALDFVDALWSQLETDAGLAFTEEAIKHFALLRSLPMEWQRIKPRFRKAGIKLSDMENLIKALQSEQAEQARAQTSSLLEKPEEKPLHKVGDALFDVPLSARHLLIPRGYTLRDVGIQGSENEDVAYTPVLITRVLSDIDGEAASLALIWKTSQGWKNLIAPRAVLMNSQQILTLATHAEFPVNSDNARELVKWFAKFEVVNKDLLQKQNISGQLGWQGKDGEHGFLLGQQYITPNGEALQVDAEKHAPLIFHTNDPGSEQVANGYTHKGTFERWFQVVSKTDRYPAVQMALMAAFIPVILPIVDAANVIVDFSNRTSTGKTTALRVAASVWGCADNRQPDSLIHPWSFTRVWVERASAMLNGLPLICDDTKQARNAQLVSQTLYDVANGRGKGRGSLTGLQTSCRWRTVLLSTGEAPATSFTEDGGTRTRCISVTRPPFGKDNEETAKFVRALNREVCENYGHAGVKFVQWLLQHREQWPEFARQYRECIKTFDAQSGAASRMAEHLALFQVVGNLGYEAGVLPWKYDGVPDELAKAIMQEADEASGELRALRHALSWAAAHEKPICRQGGTRLAWRKERPTCMGRALGCPGRVRPVFSSPHP